MIEDDVLAMEKPSLDNFLGRREVDQIFALRGERIRFQRTVGGIYGMHFKNMPELDTPYGYSSCSGCSRCRALRCSGASRRPSVFEDAPRFQALTEQQLDEIGQYLQPRRARGRDDFRKWSTPKPAPFQLSDPSTAH
ncbi:MAG: hypothetical protein ABW163_08195 [Luteimonas sp.]